MITLIQYAGQNVSPENDSSVYNALARGANSCLTEIEANINEQGKIAFTDGYLLIQGRVVHLESHTINPVLPESGTATGTIYIEIDITNADAPCQIKTTLDSFIPIQGDINLGGSLYQLKIGTYSATSVQAVAGTINMTLPANADTSFLLGYKNDATGRAKIDADATGAYVNLFSENNTSNSGVELRATNIGSYLSLASPVDNTHINIDTTNGGQLSVEKGDGAVFITTQNGAGRIYVTDSDGNVAAGLGTTNFFANGALFPNGLSLANGIGINASNNGLNIENASQTNIYGGYVDENGYASGTRFLAGEAITNKIYVGQMVAKIGYDGDGGRLIIYNRNGDERIRMGITGSGAGKIEILDADGNSHKVLTE